MNSNYRKFYVNDPEFFLKVMGEEPQPYNFKIHVFRRGEPEEPHSKQAIDDELKISELLDEYGATNVQRMGTGHTDERGDNKQRYLFTIEDQKKALDCFAKIAFDEKSILESRAQVKIFYVKQGKPLFSAFLTSIKNDSLSNDGLL